MYSLLQFIDLVIEVPVAMQSFYSIADNTLHCVVDNVLYCLVSVTETEVECSSFT